MTEAHKRPFGQHGDTWAIVSLALVNLLLNVLTLSLWRFWAKTRVRRFLWGNSTAWGDPVEYTGTGRELFLGFLMVLVAIFLPMAAAFALVQGLIQTGNVWAASLMVALQVLVLFLAGAGLYRARRYQMSRTRWRSIRGGQTGEAWRYGVMVIAAGIATSVSLGWAWPWAEMTLARYRIGNTTIGDQPFTCEARSSRLYPRFGIFWAGALACFVVLMLIGKAVFPTDIGPAEKAEAGLIMIGAFLVLAPLLVGIPYAGYKAALYRELAANTRFADTRFAFPATSWGMANWLISTLSLGILKPWAALRTFRYASNNLHVIGEPDFARIRQTHAEHTRTGEGLAAVFDGAGEF